MVDHLKAVGAAIKKSPQAIRKKFANDRDGHQVLDEDWYHSEDPVTSGVSFFVKYLGSTAAQKTHGPGSTEEPVKKIVTDAKFRKSKLQKVKLTVSVKSILLMEADLKSKLDEIPLYRVSYCTVDGYYDKVFCYISRNSETKKLECHAFLCDKRSKAEAITLTVAQAFNIAYEKWQERKKVPEDIERKLMAKPQQKKNIPTEHKPEMDTVQMDTIQLGTLLDVPVPIRPLTPAPQPTMAIEVTPSSPTHIGTNPFRTTGTPSPMPSPLLPRRGESPSFNTLDVQSNISKAKSLDHIAIEDELDFEFQQLAEGRSNPNLLDIGGLDPATVSGEVKHYMLLGDRSMENLAHSKSHDNLFL